MLLCSFCLEIKKNVVTLLTFPFMNKTFNKFCKEIISTKINSKKINKVNENKYNIFKFNFTKKKET